MSCGESHLMKFDNRLQESEGSSWNRGIASSLAIGLKCLILGVVLCIQAFPEERVAHESAEALLQHARENRETLSPSFLGFRSKLVVTHGGRIYHGEMQFRPPITLEVEFRDSEIRKLVKPLVRSLLSHRMRSDRSRNENVRFAEPDEHPLGRRILLGDKYGSSYRIRDGQILEVDRHLEDSRLVISVLETKTTLLGTHLPTHFFVTVFDSETGAVKSASAYRDVYEQIGGEHLPRSRHVIKTAEGHTQGLLVEWADIELLSPVGTE